MSDITAFLLARIAEDEAMARAAGGETTEPLARWWAPARWPASAFADHVAQWNPARVLAECAARRETVELHELVELASGKRGCGYCQSDSPEGAEWVGPCTDLCIMAMPYNQHPDWNLGWSP